MKNIFHAWKMFFIDRNFLCFLYIEIFYAYIDFCSALGGGLQGGDGGQEASGGGGDHATAAGSGEAPGPGPSSPGVALEQAHSERNWGAIGCV